MCLKTSELFMDKAEWVAETSHILLDTGDSAAAADRALFALFDASRSVVLAHLAHPGDDIFAGQAQRLVELAESFVATMREVRSIALNSLVSTALPTSAESAPDA